MKLYIDEQDRIADIGTAKSDNLREIYIDENAEDFPFKGWSNTRLKCYVIEVENGRVTMFAPYVPLEYIEKLEQQDKELTLMQLALCELYEGMMM